MFISLWFLKREKYMYNLKLIVMGRNQHVVPYNGKWGVRGAGKSKVTKTANTQQEAINTAREIAKNQQSEMIVHRPNGQIRDKNSYGNDPFPPEG
jgi:hypothetical protein